MSDKHGKGDKPAKATVRAVTAIEIATTAVRLVTATQTVEEHNVSVDVKRATAIDLPDGAVVDGTIANLSAVTAAVKKAARRSHAKNVIVGVNSPQLDVKPLSFRDVAGRDLRDMLKPLADKAVSLPPEKAAVDFCPFPDATDGQDGKTTGLIVAVPRRVVNDAIAAVSGAGLTIGRIDLNALALLRPIAVADGGTGAVVDLGASMATIGIHQGGIPRLLRTVAHGGNRITGQLSHLASVDTESAEQLKTGHGLAADSSVRDHLLRILQPLFGEIKSAIRYYQRAASSVEPVGHITLTGGGAQLPYLAGALSETAGIDVTIADGGTERHETPPTQVSMGLVMGLVMGMVQP